ncbi:MAG: LPS assembly protein LptD [Opitutaceae bacterium]|nr:LPS assembly protein LptD [Opitutaceae bacterium]
MTSRITRIAILAVSIAAQHLPAAQDGGQTGEDEIVVLTNGGFRVTPPPANRPEFNAGSFDTDPATGDYVGTGDARLDYQDALLTADEIRYHPRTQTATARGHVELTRAGQRLVAGEITYRFPDQTFSATDIRLGEFPFYISGERANGTPSEITLANARITYTEPGPFAPALHAGTLVYGPDRRIRTQDTRLGLGPVTLLPLPRLNQPLGGTALSRTDARLGQRGNLGFFLGLGIETPMLEGVEAGAAAAFHTKRGLLIGPTATYDTTRPGGHAAGSLRTGYIHDYGDRLADVLARPIQSDRAFVAWTHHQNITENVSVFGEIHYWSDSEITRDFRADEFHRLQHPDNFLETNYTGRNYVISLLARAQLNPYHSVQQRLPELRFDLLPVASGLGIYQRLQLSAASLTDNAPAGAPTLDSNRLDGYYALERPVTLGDWASFTPILGGRLTHYADANPGDGTNHYTRALGEIGFDASLRASGIFDYKNEQWRIDGLRHLVTPRLSYRYIPRADKGRPCIPAIDDRTFTTYLQPLGLGDQRYIDELRPANTLRIGLDQTLQTRHPEYGSRDLAMLNLAADLHFGNTAATAAAQRTGTAAATAAAAAQRSGNTATATAASATAATSAATAATTATAASAATAATATGAGARSAARRNARRLSDLYAEFALMPATWLRFDFFTSLDSRDIILREFNAGLTLHDGERWSLTLSNEYLRDQIEEYVGEFRYRFNEVWRGYLRLHYDARETRFNERTIGLIQNIANGLWTIRYGMTLYDGNTRESDFGFNINITIARF